MNYHQPRFKSEQQLPAYIFVQLLLDTRKRLVVLRDVQQLYATHCLTVIKNESILL